MCGWREGVCVCVCVEGGRDRCVCGGRVCGGRDRCVSM